MLQSGALSGGSGGSGGFTTSVVPVPAAPAPVSPPAALVTAAAVLSEVSRLFSKPKLKAHLDPKNIIKLEGMSTDEIASMIQSGSMFGADSAAASAAAADDKVDGNGNGAESSDDGARPVANTATTPHSLHVLEGTRRAPPASSRIPEPPPAASAVPHFMLTCSTDTDDVMTFRPESPTTPTRTAAAAAVGVQSLNVRTSPKDAANALDVPEGKLIKKRRSGILHGRCDNVCQCWVAMPPCCC